MNTITIAVIADSHFDRSPNGRFAECCHIHDWIAGDLARRQPTLILHAGDLFDGRSSPAERWAVADWLRQCAAVAPMVIVAGNHDAVGELRLFGRLDGDHHITVRDAPSRVLVRGVSVACLPWPRKAELLASMSHPLAPEHAAELAGEAMRDVLRSLQRPSGGVRPHILLAHAMVRGSRTSSGQPLVGCDLELGIEDLALAQADAVVLGHIHAPQEWSWSRDGILTPIAYVGSPRRTNYGEAEAKSYLWMTLTENADGRWIAEIERVETPCQEMILLEGRPGGAEVPGLVIVGGWPDDPERVRGADVRMRYRVPADQRDAARHDAASTRARLLDQWGPERVTVEEVVIPTTTARDTTVAAAGSTADKLRALWALRADAPDAARAERVLSRLAGLEMDHG